MKFKCSECEKNPKFQKAWGCIDEPQLTVPLLEEKENGVHYIYKRCPVNFIPIGVIKFMQIYTYQKDFPGASMPPFSEVNTRFVNAYKYYEAKLHEFTQEKIKNG